jgi:adenine-specific DNA-methyltransferase
MGGARRAKITVEAEAEDPKLNRMWQDLRLVAAELKGLRRGALRVCEDILNNRLPGLSVSDFLSDLPAIERHFWIASLYALLMPPGRRRRLAVYFTPPYLARYSINVLIDAGVKPGVHRILDPASGGAAFLVPLASHIANECRRRGLTGKEALRRIESTLAGIEVEPDLASLSQSLLTELLSGEMSGAGKKKLQMDIQRANALTLREPERLYDAVIGNPPYGRIFRPSRRLLKTFAPVVTDGYVNLYGLFVKRSLDLVKPGGIVCLILPLSFIGGSNFSSLRKYILGSARVVRLDVIEKRDDVFLDVLYDLCVLVLEKKDAKSRYVKPQCSLLTANQTAINLGSLDVPLFPSRRIWALPDGVQSDRLFESGLANLRDYGYLTKAGYFVWNREKEKYRTGFGPRSTEVPLFWAHNVRANLLCAPLADHSGSDRLGFVKIGADSTAVVRTDAILLQRTSNRRQKRRLIAGIIRQSRVPGEKGFVTENHTILILPDPTKKQRLSLSLLCRLLNTEAVDSRFRRMSGTVSVSTKALRSLPLPAADKVREAFAEASSDDEASEIAYAHSVAGNDKKSSRTHAAGS